MGRNVNATLFLLNGYLVLSCGYNPDLVAAVKALPGQDRRFDPATKNWLVDPKHELTLRQLVLQHLGCDLPPVMGKARQVAIKPELKLMEVRYLGQCKQREDGSSSAYGYDGAQWCFIFPENALRQWWDAEVDPAPTGAAPKVDPAAATTLYAVLGVGKHASQDEIKAGFRRVARQWHPDVCSEPNAHEMFIKIQHAAQILQDPKLKARYDVGLSLESKAARAAEDWGKHPTDHTYLAASYVPPLRCGMVMAEGIPTLRGFLVQKILAWEDIVQGDKTLVVSWPNGADKPQERWV